MTKGQMKMNGLLKLPKSVRRSSSWRRTWTVCGRPLSPSAIRIENGPAERCDPSAHERILMMCNPSPYANPACVPRNVARASAALRLLGPGNGVIWLS